MFFRVQYSDVNIFISSPPQAPLVSLGQRVCRASQEEEDQMGLPVCLEVLEDLALRVKEKPLMHSDSLYPNGMT